MKGKVKLMEQNNREEIEIDLKQIFYVLLDKLLIILASGVLVGAIAFAFTKFLVAPKYQAITTTCVLNVDSENDIDANDFVTGNYLSKNYVEIVKSNTVFDEVKDVLNLDVSTEDLKKKVNVVNIENTQYIKITVTDTDPYRAQEIANAVRIASEKAIMRILNVSAVNVIDEAKVPTTPVSPNILKNVIIGFLVGVVIAIIMIIIRFIMDDSIKSPEDIEKYLGISTLASIPVMSESEYDGAKSKKKSNIKRNPVAQNRPKRETVR